MVLSLERVARLEALLVACGWHIMNVEEVDSACMSTEGVILRNRADLAHGPHTTHYFLCLDGYVVGGILLVEAQSALDGMGEAVVDYLHLPLMASERCVMPFLYREYEGHIRLTCFLGGDAWCRTTFAFPRPETLAQLLMEAPEGVSLATSTLLHARVRAMPELADDQLLPCQCAGVARIEHSLSSRSYRTLVEMPTDRVGTGTLIACLARLKRYAHIGRVLYVSAESHRPLLDFASYRDPNSREGLHLTELYAVRQESSSVGLTSSTSIYITSAKRLFMLLTREPSGQDTTIAARRQKEKGLAGLRYNARIPIDSFDVVMFDGWDQGDQAGYHEALLHYFDAYHICVVNKTSEALLLLFENNKVMRYDHKQAVRDGVHVPITVLSICTEATERKLRCEELSPKSSGDNQGEVSYQAMHGPEWEAVRLMQASEIPSLYAGREDVPKTLVLVRDERQADEVLLAISAAFKRPWGFAEKLTRRTRKPDERVLAFENGYYPRILVVTIPELLPASLQPLEILLLLTPCPSVETRVNLIQLGAICQDVGQCSEVSPTFETTVKMNYLIIDAVESFASDDASDEALKHTCF